MSRVYHPDAETVEFLNHLHRGGTFAYFWTCETVKTYPSKGGKPELCKQTHWFDAGHPESFDFESTENLYFGINPTNISREPWQRVTADIVSAINCLFAEFDAKRLGSMEAAFAKINTLPVEPSVIINSGGGYHCYWLLDAPYILDETNRIKIQVLMVDWRKLLDSEPESKDLPRVLRLPGTYNVKPDYAPDFPAVAFVKRDMSCLYAIDELAAMVPPRPVVQTHKSSYVPSAETPRRRAYSQMVIRKTVDRLASAPEGTRHHSAMVAGFAMADLVAGGWIGSGDALSELEAGVRGFNKPGDAYAVAEWAFYRGGNTPAQFPDSFEEVEPHFNPQGFACCPEHPDLPLRPGKKGGYYCSKRMDAGYCDYRWAGDNYTPPTDMSLSAFRQSIISGFVSKSRVEV